MKKLAHNTAAITVFVLIALAFSFQITAAQINISIPKLPKIKKDKAEQVKPGSTNTAPGDDVKTNPDAPANYDAGLKVGDNGIAVDRLRLLSPVKILARSGNAYKVEVLEPPNHTFWYSVNSVYPYFDKQQFVDIKYGNHRYMTPYLECYAKKHNLEIDKVNNAGEWIPRYDNAQQMKKSLEDQMPKLAEIANRIGGLQSRPNTFLGYDDNPTIWEEISTNREQYLQCAVGAKQSTAVTENVWLQRHLEEIGNRQKEVESFTPGRGWFVGNFTYDHLLNAVSPSARARFLKDANAEDFKPYLDPAFDKLAASAAEKLPLYQPNTKAYAVHNATEEGLMKGVINDLKDHKIFYTGIQEASWLIETNALGIPTARFKHGMVWVRYVPNDHPYCRVYYINIIQKYAGGGTYGASYALFVKDELFGCPASK